MLHFSCLSLIFLSPFSPTPSFPLLNLRTYLNTYTHTHTHIHTHTHTYIQSMFKESCSSRGVQSTGHRGQGVLCLRPSCQSLRQRVRNVSLIFYFILSNELCCVLLYCIVLYCIVLYCIVLYCICYVVPYLI